MDRWSDVIYMIPGNGNTLTFQSSYLRWPHEPPVVVSLLRVILPGHVPTLCLCLLILLLLFICTRIHYRNLWFCCDFCEAPFPGHKHVQQLQFIQREFLHLHWPFCSARVSRFDSPFPILVVFPDFIGILLHKNISDSSHILVAHMGVLYLP